MTAFRHVVATTALRLQVDGAIVEATIAPPRGARAAMPGRDVRLLVDTGASHSLIDQTIADDLGLIPSGYTPVRFALGDAEQCPIYEVAMGLRVAGDDGRIGRVELSATVVGRASTGAPTAGLLGRDFLRFATLHYDGIGGRVEFLVHLSGRP